MLSKEFGPIFVITLKCLSDQWVEWLVNVESCLEASHEVASDTFNSLNLVWVPCCLFQDRRCEGVQISYFLEERSWFKDPDRKCQANY